MPEVEIVFLLFEDMVHADVIIQGYASWIVLLSVVRIMSDGIIAFFLLRCAGFDRFMFFHPILGTCGLSTSSSAITMTLSFKSEGPLCAHRYFFDLYYEYNKSSDGCHVLEMCS